jgi:PEGA domain-containing protein
MRRICAVIIWLAVPLVASGQTPAAAPQSGSLPPIGLPLPPIGLPLPSIGLPPPNAQQQNEFPFPGTRPSQRPPRGRRGLGSTVFFVPTYPWVGLAPGEIALPPSEPAQTGVATIEPPPLGSLRLDIHPARAQLFVNGEYIGTPEDFNGELELEAGSHTFEIRSPGYETLVVSVKITAGRSITYRGELKRVDRDAAPRPARQPSADREEKKEPAVAPPPTTFYYIPGCYMGNVPPEKVALPANCDLSRLVTRTP